jgi:UTP--glucose-1-phosphate uridylyltransferase
VIFITGRGKGGIEDHFDYNYELESILEDRGKFQELERVREISAMIRTVAVRQKKPLGLGHAIYCAREIVGDEYFMVLLPDDIISSDPPCTREMMEVFDKYGQAVVSLMRVPKEHTDHYGIVTGEAWSPGLHRIRTLVEKPDPAIAPSDLAIIGRYLLPPEIFDYLEAGRPDASGEIQLTDALARLARERALIGYEFSGMRHDVGDKFGFLTANITYGLHHEEIGPRLREYLQQRIEAGDFD